MSFFLGGLGQGVESGFGQVSKFGGLRNRMLGQGGQQPMMGRPMQLETEPGDVPVGFQLGEQPFIPSQQDNFLQRLISLFGGR